MVLKMSIKKRINRILWVCSLVVITIACKASFSGRETCPIDDLLINAANLPGDQWEEVGSRSYRDAPSKLGIDRIGTGFSTPYYGVAGELVYRFKSEKDANAGYLELIDLSHRLEPEGTKWSLLSIPSELAINADDYRLECSISSNGNVRTCWYMARYGKTVIEFRTAMIIVSENDLFNVLETINQKVKTCDAL